MASIDERCDRSAATLTTSTSKRDRRAIPRLLRLDQIVQDNIGSRAGKAFRHGQTKARRRAGHESPFALQHCHFA